MLKIHLDRKNYNEKYGDWEKKLSYMDLAKIQIGIESGDDVNITFDTYLILVNDKIEIGETIFINRFGRLNFSDNFEKDINAYKTYPIDISKSNFEFFDAEALIDKSFVLGTINSMDSLIEKLLSWNLENKIIIPKLSKDILRYLKVWATNFNIDIQVAAEFNGLQKANYEIDELAKIKYKTADVVWRKFRVYENPTESNDKVEISQGEIIQSMIKSAIDANEGKDYRDHFITAPTGTGKSIMFQSAAYYLAENLQLLTVVVSPLKALMHDQVSDMKKSYAGVETINSDTNFIERTRIIDDIKLGKVNIVYVSPETLLANNYKRLFSDRRLGLMVIDEAHIATTWGKGFRPDYWYLDKWISRTRKDIGSFEIATFTATASFSAMNDDAMNRETTLNLDMQNVIEVIAPAYREDISYDFSLSEKSFSTDEYVEYKFKKMYERIKKDPNSKKLIYFPYTSHIKEFHKYLSDSGIKSEMYFGSRSKEMKQEAFENYLNGTTKIMLATKAFGMGIDISDIQEVIHFAPTGTLNDYLQEVGRSAREVGLKGIGEFDAVFPKEGQKGLSDFRFIDQLHGMSAINTHDIRNIANVILKAYDKHKQQNLLISMDNFATADNDDKEVNKMKTAFVMLQKDILNKWNFPGIIIRPSMVMTDALMYKSPMAMEKFNKFATKKDGMENIYSVNLELVWENFFKEYSFPTFKYMLFSTKKMLEHNFTDSEIKRIRDFKMSYSPRQVIEFASGDPEGDLIKSRDFGTRIIGLLTKGSSEVSEANIIFTAKELGISKFLIYEFLEALINYQTFENNRATKKGQMSFNKSIAQNKSRGSYTIRDKYLLRKPFLSLLTAVRQKSENSKLIFPIIIDNESAYLAWMYQLKLFEVLNQFDVEVLSGDKPKVFVRVNLRKTLEVVMDEYYSNMFVKSAKLKYKYDKEVLQEFLSTQMKQEERWRFIEDYFLPDLAEDKQ